MKMIIIMIYARNGFGWNMRLTLAGAECSLGWAHITDPLVVVPPEQHLTTLLTDGSVCLNLCHKPDIYHTELNLAQYKTVVYPVH